VLWGLGGVGLGGGGGGGVFGGVGVVWVGLGVGVGGFLFFLLCVGLVCGGLFFTPQKNKTTKNRGWCVGGGVFFVWRNFFS